MLQKSFQYIIALSGDVRRTAPKAKIIFREHCLWKLARETSCWEWSHLRSGVSRWEAVSFLGQHQVKRWVCGLIGCYWKSDFMSLSPRGSDVYKRREVENRKHHIHVSCILLTMEPFICLMLETIVALGLEIIISWRLWLVGEHYCFGVGRILKYKRHSRSLLIHSLSTSLLD